MLKKPIQFMLSGFVILAMLAVASPAFALTGTKNVKGRVIAINRLTHVMILRTSVGTKMRLKYNRLNTQLWHNGVQIRLARLHVGNIVNVSYTPARLGPGMANEVDDDNGQFEISGTVAAVDTTLGTLSIASENGGSTVVLKVDSTTVITRNGMPATLGDLMFGDQVEAKYDSATMLASSIKAESSVEDGEIEGSVTAVDTTANTITISGEGSGSGGGDSLTTPMDVTLNVTTDTVIMLDGSPAKLSSLQVGMKAEAQYDPTTMNAKFIEAENEGS